MLSLQGERPIQTDSGTRRGPIVSTAQLFRIGDRLQGEYMTIYSVVQWNLDLRACKIRANPDLRAISVPTIFLFSKFTSK